MTTPESRNDNWAVGDAYEPYVGRWSRLVAREFLEWLGLPTGLRWLDVGSGTGVLSRAILEHGSPAGITGVDSSEAFVAYAAAHTDDARASFRVSNAAELPLRSDSYEAVVSGLMLNFVPEPARALAEMARVATPGGTVAAYVWDYAERMELMRYFWDAAVALDPSARGLDEGVRFPLAREEPLRDLFHSARLSSIETRAIDVPTIFRDFDDYWSPFLGAQGPAPGYAMALTEERRAALRERVRTALPNSSDGSIHLVARAWAVRGQRRGHG